MTWRHLASAAALAVGLVEGSSWSARAADLGGAPPPAPTYYAPPAERETFDRWTGLYVGGALGYSFGTTALGGDIGSYSFDNRGSTGSILAGANWRAGRLVFGLEADVGIGQLKAGIDTPSGTFTEDVKYFGTLRGRVGLLLTPSLLVYGTGGFAWQNADLTLAGVTDNKTFTGYVVGGGAELAISQHVGLRLEYLYTDLGTSDVPQAGLANTYNPTSHAVRAGITFKF